MKWLQLPDCILIRWLVTELKSDSQFFHISKHIVILYIAYTYPHIPARC